MQPGTAGIGSYANVLVETADCEAYIRAGDECHKLTDEEKQEVAADKGQVQTELQSVNGNTFPADFDEKQIKAFADRYRAGGLRCYPCGFSVISTVLDELSKQILR